jgi:hypothetical protein
VEKLPGVNESLIRLVVAQIEDTPQHWDQKNWCESEDVCKTTFCFAGWVAFLNDMTDGWGKQTAKGRKYMDSIGWGDMREFAFDLYATEALGVDLDTANKLFSPYADGFTETGETLSTGQRIRNMKETIYQATGVDIP